MKTQAFENNADRYEEWFVKHKAAYLSELDAVRALMPLTHSGLEIGVGTGRFALPLGIKTGVEPCETMADKARAAGLNVVGGIAENLPFPDESFDLTLMVTTICFVTLPERSLKEAWRVLSQGGVMLVGFVDLESPIGRTYREHQHESVFYQEAVFYSTDEILTLMQGAGFHDFEFKQTLFHPLDEISETEPVLDGYGKGSFVVVKGVK